MSVRTLRSTPSSSVEHLALRVWREQCGGWLLLSVHPRGYLRRGGHVPNGCHDYRFSIRQARAVPSLTCQDRGRRNSALLDRRCGHDPGRVVSGLLRYRTKARNDSAGARACSDLRRTHWRHSLLLYCSGNPKSRRNQLRLSVQGDPARVDRNVLSLRFAPEAALLFLSLMPRFWHSAVGYHWSRCTFGSVVLPHAWNPGAGFTITDRPPSATKHSPVTNDDSSLARNRAQ